MNSIRNYSDLWRVEGEALGATQDASFRPNNSQLSACIALAVGPAVGPIVDLLASIRRFSKS